MKSNRIVSVIIIIISAILIYVGIKTGQPASVLVKAIKICMECVGIG